MLFGAAGLGYMAQYDAPARLFAEVGAKTRAHAADNPYAIFREPLTVDDILASPQLSFGGSLIDAVGGALTRTAAAAVYEQSGVDPRDVSVVELHDCFTVSEVLIYESLGLTDEGGAEKFVAAGDNTYGGRVVVGPSGGLMSKGHPLGATGLAQCTELVWQLRGAAGDRQVPDVRLALQHNLGLGGAGVVTLYEKIP